MAIMAATDILVVIPSRGRSKEICDNPLYAHATVVVTSDQAVDEYRAAARTRGVQTGKFVVFENQVNLAYVRNFILENLFPQDAPLVMMVDDDFMGMRPLYVWRSQLVRKTEDILSIFGESYITASDLGTSLFGYAVNADPQRRTCEMPAHVRGWVSSGCTGHMDRRMRNDQSLYMMEDIDLSLQVQAERRILWQDLRWYAQDKPGYTKGGNSAIRTEQRRLEGFQAMNNRRLEGFQAMNNKWGSGTVSAANYQNELRSFTLNIDAPAGGHVKKGRRR